MATPELPPLTTYDHECVDDYGDFRSKMVEDNLGEWVRVIEVEARERILLARIAELQEEADRRTREVEATYHVQRTLRERIAELEADAARYRWLRTATYLDGETLAVFVIDEASEIANKGEWLSDEQLDAAIDAAREAKP